MKKSLIITVSFIVAALPSFAWGRLGHSTIAEIAERHLTPKAKANIDKYTGGAKLGSFASWMDEVAGTEPYKTFTKGWHASIADSDCNSPLSVRWENRQCRDGVTAMEFFREYLKDYRTLSDSAVLVSIKCITHIVGDFHCIQHVRYTDCHNEGKYPVTFNGRQLKSYHSFWDSMLIQNASGLKAGDYETYADRLDTWNKSQIRKATRGWAREWFEDAARNVRPTINEVHPGSELDDRYIADHIGLAEDMLRKSGYQLAAALNEIFGK